MDPIKSMETNTSEFEPYHPNSLVDVEWTEVVNRKRHRKQKKAVDQTAIVSNGDLTNGDNVFGLLDEQADNQRREMMNGESNGVENDSNETRRRRRRSFNLKIQRTYPEGGGADGSLYKEAEKSCNVISGRVSRGISCFKGTTLACAVLAAVGAVALIVLSANPVEALELQQYIH